MSRNRLGGETSPYLLQHSDNPVDWWPWSAAALAEAEATGKPILLSIGYAACHWCHVMAHESFEDEEVAAVMNRLFVNIKVDREERPDIDQIYMSALHAMGEQGGWPMTMFLTPKGEPVWGGTYFPKTPRYGRPGFIQIMHAIARVFREEPDKIEQNKAALLDALRKPEAPTHPVPPDIVPQAAEKLLGLMDPVNGGTRGAPKFPNATLLDLLWRAGRHDGDSRYRGAVTKALDGMALGGIYDHLAGGFARYSVDEQWLAPHFEKMLSDNGLLLSLYVHAAAVTGSQLYRQRIERTVDWLTHEMQAEGGGFAASLDADSEGSEGKFYVWREEEVRELLDTREFEAFARTYDIRPGGNWEGVTILNRLGSEPVADPPELAAARAKLLTRRNERVRPGLDDKVLADWNGYAIRGITEAARLLDRPDWLTAAERAYRSVEATHGRGDRLCHAWRAGAATFPGFASDYAAMIAAALALHETTRAGAYLGDAVRWTRALDTHHWDSESGGYFLAADDADDLIVRMKMPYDEAAPNANGLMAQNLARLWCFTGEPGYRERGEALVAAFSQPILQNVFGAASLLSGFDMLTRLDHAVVVVPEGGDPGELVRVLYERGDPGLSVVVAEEGAAFPASHPAGGKTALDGRPTAYLCSAMQCSAPVTEANRLAA